MHAVWNVPGLVSFRAPKYGIKLLSPIVYCMVLLGPNVICNFSVNKLLMSSFQCFKFENFKCQTTIVSFSC